MTRRFAVVAAIVAACVCIGGGALAVVQVRSLSHDNAIADARTQSLSAARQIAVDFFSYDYRHIDKDFARVVAESTGKLKSDFITQSAGVRDLIVKAQAVSTAQIASAGVVNASTSKASVIVALNRTIANISAPRGQSNAVDLQIDLVKLHGRWIASAVKPL